MTVFSVPQIRIDGVVLDPWRVLLPLEYGYGRARPVQQPDPGGCQFEYVGAPTFQAGSRVEILLAGSVIWRGDITGRTVSWETIEDEPVYAITATGWAYRLNRVFLREAVWIPAGTDAQQVAAVLAAFAPLLDAPLDPPIVVANVTDPAILQGWWMTEGTNLLQALQEHGASTGAIVWEFVDGVAYVGPPARENAPVPTRSIRSGLVEMPVDYEESEVINRVLLSYGRYPQDSDGSTMGEWRWRLQAGAPSSGEVAWDSATMRLSVHEIDNNGTNVRLDLLNAIEGNGIYVLSPVEARRLRGTVDARSVAGQIFTWTLSEAAAGAAGLPTNNAVCSVSTGSPSGEQTYLAEDLPSQAQYGQHEASATTYYATTAGVGPRGNRLLARWRRPRWLNTIMVNLALTSTQDEYDLVTGLAPNETVIFEDLNEGGPGIGFGAQVFTEALIHSWERTDAGDPVLRVQVATSPRSAWTRLVGYGVGPYGHGPYGRGNA